MQTEEIQQQISKEEENQILDLLARKKQELQGLQKQQRHNKNKRKRTKKNKKKISASPQIFLDYNGYDLAAKEDDEHVQEKEEQQQVDVTTNDSQQQQQDLIVQPIQTAPHIAVSTSFLRFGLWHNFWQAHCAAYHSAVPQ